MKKESWLEAETKRQEVLYKEQEQKAIDYMMSGGPCDYVERGKIMDDLVVFGQAVTIVDSAGIRHVPFEDFSEEVKESFGI